VKRWFVVVFKIKDISNMAWAVNSELQYMYERWWARP